MCLGQVANVIMQNSSHSHPGASKSMATSFGDQTLLIDLAGRPELVGAARKAVISFLDPSKDGSGSSRIQTVGATAFTVRLNTIVTREVRREMVSRGENYDFYFKITVIFVLHFETFWSSNSI